MLGFEPLTLASKAGLSKKKLNNIIVTINDARLESGLVKWWDEQCWMAILPIFGLKLAVLG